MGGGGVAEKEKNMTQYRFSAVFMGTLLLGNGRVKLIERRKQMRSQNNNLGVFT